MTAILLLVASTIGPVQSLLDQADFEPGFGKTDFRRPSTKTSLRIYGNKVVRTDRSDTYYARTVDRFSQLVVRRPISLPSGFPIGLDRRYLPGHGSMQLHSFSDKFQFQIYMDAGHAQVGGVAKPVTPLTDHDFQLVEAIARWLLADGTGKAYAETTFRNGAKSYAARKDGERIHIDAEAYARDQGWTYRLNSETACAIITRPQGAITLALGAPAVKIGSEWISIPDIVIVDGTCVMLPTSILSRL